MKRFQSSLGQRILRSPSRLASWLLRFWFWANRSARAGRAGFVLPTTVLLLLMLSLTVGALSFRAFTRVNQTIAFREQQAIDEFAAPAIDRAKAKIEYMFTQDQEIVNKRPPSSSDLLSAILRNAAIGGSSAHRDNDPYTLPDETQLDITGEGGADPAWSFISGDTTVVYSVLMSHETDNAVFPSGPALTLVDDSATNKAGVLVTRNGPINTQEPLVNCPISSLAGGGWQDAGANLQKNFQVNVLSIANSGGPSRTVSAAEYQQVRSYPKGSKYGAWFRYDLEVFPGSAFRWNGAMHSESNIISSDNLQAYLISSRDSCVYTTDGSDITISKSEYDDNNDGIVDYTFVGQLVAGASRDNSFGADDVNTHANVFNNATNGGESYQTPDVTRFRRNNDSIVETTGNLVTNIAVDPVKIFTEDRTESLGTGWTSEDPTGDTPYLQNRVFNLSDANRPFLDDGYRADDRFGPKPVYDARNSLKLDNGTPYGTAKKIGEPIPASNTILTAQDNANEEYGLDGFWERRAIANGLRIVVGQRLELGNTFGWGANDPLYPPEAAFGTNTDASGELDASGNKQKGAAETKQQRTLRDNLAAVQGMVAYHYGISGEIPYICMASTVHPGTQQTLINSRTFEKYPETDNWKIDFLSGQGTNGWEFDFNSFDSNSDSAITDEFADDRPMGQALRNLAYFAGDPAGGSPTFSPVQGVAGQSDEFVHPYPYQSMWGDFSVLRRIFEEYLDAASPTTYANLSPADKSTLHSAACTLGMLAYNLEQLEGYDATKFTDANLGTTYGGDISNQGDVKNEVGGPIWNAFLSNYVSSCTVSGSTYDCFPDQLPTKEELLSTATLTGDALDFANYLSDVSQVERDRKYGFQVTPSSSTLGVFVVQHAGNTYNLHFPDDCHPNDVGGTIGIGIIDSLFNASLPFVSTSDNARDAAGVALLCSTKPKYPSLFYVFPTADHDHIGNGGELQPYTTEEYLTEGGAASTYITTVNAATDTITGGVNTDPSVSARLYKAVAPASIDLTPAAAIANFNQPVTSSPTLPTTPPTAISTLASRDVLHRSVIDAEGTFYGLAFLDKAMMDGRELMSVRLLDVDLELLTTNRPTGVSDEWIARVDGIVYAAREDAVREDAIVRPRQATWATCRVFANLTDNAQDCPMDVVPTAANQLGTYDPPLNTDNDISPKPVDMYADPDRRSYGFRLINGANLNRLTGTPAASTSNAGLTFVTDNPTYIYGDFNLHQDTGGNIIEEFTDTLEAANFATLGNEGDAQTAFYSRTRAELNQNFSRPETDAWRPSEIFADSVAILSANFRDGWIEDAYIYETGGNSGTPEVNSSYLNYNRPNRDNNLTDLSVWQREDRQTTQASTDTSLPILFDRNGVNYKFDSGSYAAFPANFAASRNNGEHIAFYENDLFNRRVRNQIVPPATTRVNALMIAGIVPLRTGQNYGGLHNFPRLMEWWPGQSLIIAGGFYQLNFSTQATAPFDQDSWEPGEIPDTGTTNNMFYGAARRIWGYDVGFQYTTVSPIASRFVSFGRPRSEFYRELPLNDAYIQNLCTALQGIDTAVTCQ